MNCWNILKAAGPQHSRNGQVRGVKNLLHDRVLMVNTVYYIRRCEMDNQQPSPLVGLTRNAKYQGNGSTTRE